jgi:hypothetical protein
LEEGNEGRVRKSAVRTEVLSLASGEEHRIERA